MYVLRTLFVSILFIKHRFGYETIRLWSSSQRTRWRPIKQRNGLDKKRARPLLRLDPGLSSTRSVSLEARLVAKRCSKTQILFRPTRFEPLRRSERDVLTNLGRKTRRSERIVKKNMYFQKTPRILFSGNFYNWH